MTCLRPPLISPAGVLAFDICIKKWAKTGTECPGQDGYKETLNFQNRIDFSLISRLLQLS